MLRLATAANCGYDAWGYYSCMPTGGEAWAVILAICGVIAFISLIIYIPRVIGMWKVFEKAGEKGWKALIPIYNTIIFLQIAGLSPWWVFGTLVNPVNIFVAFYMNIELAKKFGKSTGYGVLMAFFEPIMYLVLGFGSAEYNGEVTMGGAAASAKNAAEYEREMAAYNKAYAEYEEQVKAYNEQVAKMEKDKSVVGHGKDEKKAKDL